MIRSRIISRQNRAGLLRVVLLAGSVTASAVAVVIAGVGSASGASAARAMATGATGSSNWAQYHYSAARTGFNPFEHVLSPANVSKLTKLWSLPSPGPFGSGAGVVVNGVVYFGTDINAVYAINAATGRRLWKFTGPETNEYPEAVVNGIVYVSAGSAGTIHNNLYALDAKTGHKVWSLDIAPGPLAVQDGVVYVNAGDGLTLYALNAATGRKIWSIEASGGIVSVANGVVYTADHIVEAVSAATGRRLWSFTTPGNGAANEVTVVNGLLYFGVYDGSFDPDDAIYALSATTGAVRWRFQITGQYAGYVAVAHGLVYVPGSRFYALRATTGSKVWAVTRSGGFLTAVVANGVVYSGNDNNTLYAMDASTGRVLLTLTVASSGGYSDEVDPAVADGRVFFGTSFPGRFYAIGLPKSASAPATSEWR